MASATVLIIGAGQICKREPFASLAKRYTLLATSSGKKGVELAQKQSPQIIILDSVSLRTSGNRIAQFLQKELPDVSLIHIQSSSQQVHSSTADVVLLPPFTWRKLANNIERLLQARNDDTLSSGPFSMNLTSRILTAHGQEIQLTPKLAQLFEIFMRNPGKTLDRKTLMKTIWETQYMGDTRTLDVHIRWIRQAIETGDGKPRYLKTVRGVGYRFEPG